MAGAGGPAIRGRPRTLAVGTRGSRLALAQTGIVVDLLRRADPGLTCETLVIATAGDRSAAAPRGEGAFVKEIQAALLAGRIDLAVHSLKDLPTDPVEGLSLAAVPLRGDPRDALVGGRLAELPDGARVGTGSPRRAAQLRWLRPGLEVVPVRGNVPTRVGKVGSEVDAVLLAAAGLSRLGIVPDDVLDPEVMLPAPGQGALAVEVRSSDAALADLVRTIDDAGTRAAVTAERAVLRTLGGGCMLPVAAWARVEDGVLAVEASATAPDGSAQLRAREDGDPADPLDPAARVAGRLLHAGARALLEA